MTSESTRPRSWFGIIFERGRTRLVSCAVLVAFAGLAVVGGVVPELRWWFHIPAVVAILCWYVVMMKRYRERR